MKSERALGDALLGAGGATQLDAPVDPRARVASTSVRVVDEIVEMSAIFDDAVNVVVLERSLPALLVAESERAMGARPFRIMAAVSPNERGEAELASCLTGLPKLAADVFSWVQVLAEITGCDVVGVRIARVESAMCPRLHVDRVTLRVVSTFVGAGTELVGSDDVDRTGLGRAAASASDDDRLVLREGARVQRASAGAVLLLKGEAWPNNQGRGAIHRSPAASAASPRLVMTLDPLWA